MSAQPLPAKNLALEAWNEAKTEPLGWWIQGTGGYRSSADCDLRPGRCVLRFDSLPGTPEKGKFVPLGQSLPAALAAGNRVRLSGAIRTRDVKGWAGLWMRVDAPGRPPVAFDNMFARGPRGTTDWQRFEVVLPVAPGASQVVFGALLSGTGTAWFDDLELVLDTSVKVAPLPEIVSPPRPLASQSLADDAALAIPAADQPPVPAEWQRDVRERARAIRSLFSDDFSDLQFLKPLLAGRRLVQLGESSHGAAEFNWLKVRLIKFLHRELGFDVVAFESSMTACDVADGRIGTAPPAEVMRACIHPVWHTTETLGLFEYLDAVRKSGKRLTLAGFDTQSGGAAGGVVAERLRSALHEVDPDAARRLAEDEERLAAISASGADPRLLELVPRYDEARGILERRKLELGPPAAAALEIVIQEFRSRMAFATQLSQGVTPEASRIRDRGMADNLEFLLDRAYAGRKVVAWAHNTHIAKSLHGHDEPRAMGAWIAQRRCPAEVYTLGLYMGRGVGGWNDRRPYEIAPPPRGSFEAVLANAGRTMAFVDFSTVQPAAGNEWIFRPMDAREWGVRPTTFAPARAYDAVIYIDTVTPPQYLRAGGGS